MLSALIKYSMLHSVSRGEMQQSQQNQSYNATVSKSWIKRNVAQGEPKGILRILKIKYGLALGLITTTPYGGKSWGLRIWSPSSPAALALGCYQLYQSYS